MPGRASWHVITPSQTFGQRLVVAWMRTRTGKHRPSPAPTHLAHRAWGRRQVPPHKRHACAAPRAQLNAAAGVLELDLEGLVRLQQRCREQADAQLQAHTARQGSARHAHTTLLRHIVNSYYTCAPARAWTRAHTRADMPQGRQAPKVCGAAAESRKCCLQARRRRSGAAGPWLFLWLHASKPQPQTACSMHALPNAGCW